MKWNNPSNGWQHDGVVLYVVSLFGISVLAVLIGIEIFL